MHVNGNVEVNGTSEMSAAHTECRSERMSFGFDEQIACMALIPSTFVSLHIEVVKAVRYSRQMMSSHIMGSSPEDQQRKEREEHRVQQQ